MMFPSIPSPSLSRAFLSSVIVAGTTLISASRYPVRQGHTWVFALTSSGDTQLLCLNSTDGSTLLTGYIPKYVYGVTWSSPLALSSDGMCGYFVGETHDCDVCARVARVFGFCWDTSQPPGRQFVLMYSGVWPPLTVPDQRRIAIGPLPGQITVWHAWGVVVLEAR